MAVRKGTGKAVVTAGEHLIDGHAALDASCRRIAPMLGVTLPDAAGPQQQGFATTLSADTGKRFDSDMANILRVTHGQIFDTIAKIRSTTRNSLARALADQADATVLDPITVMEDTGLVDYDRVLFQEATPPEPPASDLTPPPPSGGQPQVRGRCRRPHPTAERHVPPAVPRRRTGPGPRPGGGVRRAAVARTATRWCPGPAGGPPAERCSAGPRPAAAEQAARTGW